MKIFGYELRRVQTSAPEGRASIEDPRTSSSQILDMLGGSVRATSGLLVNEDVALNYSAVYACVDIICKTLATLPLQIFQRGAQGELPAPAHAYWAMLHDRPNPFMTSVTWRKTMQAHTLLWGNGYSRIERTRGGRATALYPLQARRVEPLIKQGALVYEVTLESGGKEELPPDEILHVPALSLDGIKGISPIGKMRNSVGLGLAAEEYGARLFENDARPGIVVELAGKLSPQAEANLKHDLNEKYKGLGNRHKAMVLEQGVKIHEVGFPPEDAQFLETRKFQRSEICSWYGVPPAMVADYEKGMTFANSEQQDLWFAKHTIRPWCVAAEQEINWKLFRGSEFFVKFNLDGLLRGDFKTRMEGLQLATGGPFMKRSEARKLEGLPPDAAFDTPIMPLNMGDANYPPRYEPKTPTSTSGQAA